MMNNNETARPAELIHIEKHIWDDMPFDKRAQIIDVIIKLAEEKVGHIKVTSNLMPTHGKLGTLDREAI